jgi:hypothetical protein
LPLFAEVTHAAPVGVGPGDGLVAVGLGLGAGDVPVGLGLGELGLGLGLGELGVGLGDGTGCPACPRHCTGTVPAGHAGGLPTLTLVRVCLEVRQA